MAKRMLTASSHLRILNYIALKVCRSVEELDWPAQTPDLNPIQCLWDELEH